MIVNDTFLTKVNCVDRLYPIHFAECENVTLCVLGDCKHIKADQYHAEEDAIVTSEEMAHVIEYNCNETVLLSTQNTC